MYIYISVTVGIPESGTNRLLLDYMSMSVCKDKITYYAVVS